MKGGEIMNFQGKEWEEKEIQEELMTKLSDTEKRKLFTKTYNDLMSKAEVFMIMAMEIKTKILDNLKVEEEKKENE